jgi:FAD synthase
LLSISNWALYNNHISDRIEIEFHPLEANLASENEEITFYFHKKLRDQSDNTDISFIQEKIEEDIREVSELIY